MLISHTLLCQEEFLKDVMQFLILRGHTRLIPQGGLAEFPDAILNAKRLDLFNLYREVRLIFFFFFFQLRWIIDCVCKWLTGRNSTCRIYCFLFTVNLLLQSWNDFRRLLETKQSGIFRWFQEVAFMLAMASIGKDRFFRRCEITQ